MSRFHGVGGSSTWPVWVVVLANRAELSWRRGVLRRFESDKPLCLGSSIPSQHMLCYYNVI